MAITVPKRVSIDTFSYSIGKCFKVLDGRLKEVVACGTDISAVGAYFFKKFAYFRPNIFFCTVGKNVELVHSAYQRQPVTYFCCKLPRLLVTADADRCQSLGHITAVGNKNR